MKISVNSKLAKYFTREYMRVTYRWCCVYNEVCVSVKVSEKCDSIKLINRYNVSQHEGSILSMVGPLRVWV